MEFALSLKKLMDEKGLTNYQLAKDLDVHPTTVANWLEGKEPRKKTQIQLANYFKVTVEALLTGEAQKETPALTEKDERDISKKLDETLAALEGSAGGLMFDGEPLDEVTKELLIASLRKDLEMGKRIAKQKYTPKKYRKPDDPEGD